MQTNIHRPSNQRAFMKLVREIRSKNGELHFRRWSIISTRFFNVFIHQIFKADQDLHEHDHPWSFISIILKNFYMVKTTDKRCLPPRSYARIKDMLSISFTPNKGIYHRIVYLASPVWSLVITGPRVNDCWGYDVDGKHIDAKTYRSLKREGKLVVTGVGGDVSG